MNNFDAVVVIYLADINVMQRNVDGNYAPRKVPKDSVLALYVDSINDTQTKL